MKSDGVIQFPRLGKESLDVNLDDIIMFSSDEQICLMNTTCGKNVKINLMLKEVQERLPDQFYRLHKQYIVNLDQVYSYGTYPTKWIRLTGGIKVPLSKTKKISFHQRMIERSKFINKMIGTVNNFVFE